MYTSKLALIAADPRLISKVCDSIGRMPNIDFPTMGGYFFWATLAEVDGWRFQKNPITDHCRILNPENIRKAWGSENAMTEALDSIEGTPKRMKVEDNIIKYGDIIGVDRGLYKHYGVYADKSKVIHYASKNGDFDGAICIHTTTLVKFLDGSDELFKCKFPIEYSILKFNYKLYSPKETVERALGRLGESEYNLVFNNCEHFAIWCKTGVSVSQQVNDLISKMLIIPVIKIDNY